MRYLPFPLHLLIRTVCDPIQLAEEGSCDVMRGEKYLLEDPLQVLVCVICGLGCFLFLFLYFLDCFGFFGSFRGDVSGTLFLSHSMSPVSS